MVSKHAVTVTFPVHWGDMDALGHVNNACFFRWFESARIEFFRRLGSTIAHAPTGEGPILATTSCDYLKPVVYPADVVVGARVTKVGRTSIAMEYELWRAGAPDELHARGASVVVLVNYATGEKVPIGDALRARIAAL